VNHYNVFSYAVPPLYQAGSEHVALWAVKGSSMEKGLCWAAMGISGLLLVLFLLDLFLGFPFGKLSLVVDVLGVLACGIILYTAFDAFKDYR
jgi:hypothetical protein